MAKKRISKKGCRQKGHDFERKTAILFRRIFPEARRHLENHKKDAQGVDLDHTGPFKIQCKRPRKYAPLSLISEIQIDPLEGGIPVLITKGDNLEPLAALPLDEFLKLLRKVYAPR